MDQLKQIKEFPQKADFGDDDLLLIQGQGTTYNVQGRAVKQYAENAAKPQVALAAKEAQAAADAADRAEAAIQHPSIPDPVSKNWLVWDQASGEYEETVPPVRAEGRDFEIKGYYPTLEALEAAVPNPDKGWAYGIGTEAPYDIYVWDVVHGAWVNNGPMTASGDMLKSVYDPQRKNQDIFAYADSVGLPAGGAVGQIPSITAEDPRVVEWTNPPEGVGRSMAGQTVEPTQGTTVTAGEGAEIFNDYRERTYLSSGTPVKGNIASGLYSHAEGKSTTANGVQSHAEGVQTVASGNNAHAEGSGTKATGNQSHSEGATTTASGFCSHAEGYSTNANSSYSHAEGKYTTASYQCAHSEGDNTTASGYRSHAEGVQTVASGNNAHAEGSYTVASESDAHAEGSYTEAKGIESHAGGLGTIAAAPYQTVIGAANVENTNMNNKFIIGKGDFSYPGGSGTTTRANCFRVNHTGVYASGSYNASGADYAELFEWADGNRERMDRAGRFVTLEGERIRLAGPGDDYILGIVSGDPSVVGDVYDDQWQGMYLTDIFGRPIMEDVEVPAVTETFEMPDNSTTGYREETSVIIPAHTERRQKLNPDYDNSLTYVPRTERPEWAAVGLLGKLVAVDDGTCVPNGWATVGEGGAATASGSRTKYRVMARLDEAHVRILIL